ncbi:hypothetical protein ACKF11_12795 [Methylobacillus sp. Pita2]|uniref:hypothetical protein n=1 Tax=Methylobacillus sp. Pita2 TaxID=3383245 RepID=UPI0038B57F81
MTSLLIFASALISIAFLGNQLSQFAIKESSTLGGLKGSLVATLPAALISAVVIAATSYSADHITLVRDASFALFMFNIAGIAGAAFVVAALKRASVSFKGQLDPYGVPLLILLAVPFFLPTFVPDFAKGKWLWFVIISMLALYALQISQPTKKIEIQQLVSSQQAQDNLFKVWADLGIGSYVIAGLMLAAITFLALQVGETFTEASALLSLSHTSLAILIVVALQYASIRRVVPLLAKDKFHLAVIQNTVLTFSTVALVLPLIVVANLGLGLELEWLFTPFQALLTALTLLVFHLVARDKDQIGLLEAAGLPLLFLAFLFNGL